MMTFSGLGLPEPMVKILDDLGFKKPTPIQEQAIPIALEGKDILASAQTGTGKTGAFGIPLSVKLLGNPHAAALVLTPTRELATQVMGLFRPLLKGDKSFSTALLIGGDPLPKQFKQLQTNPRLIVGTPGRINDHLKRGTLNLTKMHFLVLDESDRMLDLGFGPQLASIIGKMPSKRQTLMFSATMPQNIQTLASKYLRDPSHITVKPTAQLHTLLKQETLITTEENKYEQLVNQLNNRDGSIIIFVKTKRGADRLSTKLNKQNYRSDAIHGDLRQNKRDRVMHAFRQQKYSILVATDVAARGLDVPHIRHVINYDLPQCAEDYVHRIGRTARAGATGSAITFLTPSDRTKWKEITSLTQGGGSEEKNPKTGRRTPLQPKKPFSFSKPFSKERPRKSRPIRSREA